MGEPEVNIDGALLTCNDEEEVLWIDQLLENAVAGRAEGNTRWDSLVKEFLQSPKLGQGSVVRNLTYLLTTRERLLLGGEADAVEERMEATTYCCRDLAAAYMRIASVNNVEENQLKQNLAEALSAEDFSTAYQHQTDLTLAFVMSGSKSEALCSLGEEVRLSLTLGNLEGALHKITFYHLYKAGLQAISEVLETTDLSNFENLFAAQKKLYVKLLNYMDEEGGGEEDEVASDRTLATVVVSKEGVRGRVDGQFRVQDLDSALRLVRQGRGGQIFMMAYLYLGGTIFLEAGDYTCSGQCWDVRQLAEGEGREITLVILFYHIGVNHIFLSY